MFQKCDHLVVSEAEFEDVNEVVNHTLVPGFFQGIGYRVLGILPDTHTRIPDFFRYLPDTHTRIPDF